MRASRSSSFFCFFFASHASCFARRFLAFLESGTDSGTASFAPSAASGAAGLVSTGPSTVHRVGVKSSSESSAAAADVLFLASSAAGGGASAGEDIVTRIWIGRGYARIVEPRESHAERRVSVARACVLATRCRDARRVFRCSRVLTPRRRG